MRPASDRTRRSSACVGGKVPCRQICWLIKISLFPLGSFSHLCARRNSMFGVLESSASSKPGAVTFSVCKDWTAAWSFLSLFVPFMIPYSPKTVTRTPWVDRTYSPSFFYFLFHSLMQYNKNKTAVCDVKKLRQRERGREIEWVTK